MLGEYVRLVRSLAYAYVWETWPDTAPDGAPMTQRRRRRPSTPLDAEVLVVGSGAGGAPTAALLAEAGFDVLVLEEGALVHQGEVVPFSLEQMDRQYRAGGVTVALGLPSIAYTEGCCAGGGTEVNSGLYRRPPEDGARAVAARRTELADFDPDELYAHLRRGRARAVACRPCPARRPRPARRCAAAPPRSAGATTRSPAG